MSDFRGRRVLMLGTFDPEFPRNRQLLRLLAQLGCQVECCALPLWGADRVADLTQRRWQRVAASVTLAWRLPMRLLGFIWRHHRRPDWVLVPHPAQLDAGVIGLLCRLLRVPLVVDFFVSLHETVVLDRRLIRPGSPLALGLQWADSAAARLADVLLADTPENADHFSACTGTPRRRWRVLPIGVDAAHFAPRPERDSMPATVLFYGTYIPLHGIETIVRAACLLPPHYRVQLLGDGQQRPAIEALVRELSAPVEMLAAVPETQLADRIAQAQVCLGIFGEGPKAQRVIPNKVLQCLAVGRPVITAETPAVACLGEAVTRVAAADPVRLAAAIHALMADAPRRAHQLQTGLVLVQARFSDEALAPSLAEALALAADRPGQAPLSLGGHLRWPLIAALLREAAPASILEVGAGQGAVGVRLARWSRYLGLEPDARSAAVAAQRLAASPGAQLRHGDIESLAPEERFDLVCAFEVLEHLEDDVGALRRWGEHLSPGGTLLLSVPAHRRRFGPADAAVGHWRRYDAADLEAVLHAAGFTIVARRCYGALGGHLVEQLRHWLIPWRLRGASDVAARSAASGRVFQPASGMMALVVSLLAWPLKALQAPFTGGDFGVGWVVAARRRAD
ncbi:MAG: methyltransferase domain-containing protein [Candidatus Sericytochromatia bacterium]|nr:methyltransferase domain-containing protein [Candidatus Sericytochromatia bacterium]